jgi:hypothetical protein
MTYGPSKISLIRILGRKGLGGPEDIRQRAGSSDRNPGQSDRWNQQSPSFFHKTIFLIFFAKTRAREVSKTYTWDH